MAGILWREIDSSCVVQEDEAAREEQIRWQEAEQPLDMYARLEVSPYASMDAIRRAYRALMEKYHPDRHPESRRLWAESIAKQLNQAYWVLKDAERRAAYDQRNSI